MTSHEAWQTALLHRMGLVTKPTPARTRTKQHKGAHYTLHVWGYPGQDAVVEVVTTHAGKPSTVQVHFVDKLLDPGAGQALLDSLRGESKPWLDVLRAMLRAADAPRIGPQNLCAHCTVHQGSEHTRCGNRACDCRCRRG